MAKPHRNLRTYAAIIPVLLPATRNSDLWIMGLIDFGDARSRSGTGKLLNLEGGTSIGRNEGFRYGERQKKVRVTLINLGRNNRLFNPGDLSKCST